MIDDIINKIENLEFDDDFFNDNELLLNALGLALGPSGLVLITAIKKANQLNSITSVLVNTIKKACDDSNINLDNKFFKDNLKYMLTDDIEKEILSKISKSKNIDLIEIQTDERWA